MAVAEHAGVGGVDRGQSLSRQMIEKDAVVRAIRKHVPEMRAAEGMIEARPVSVGIAA